MVPGEVRGQQMGPVLSDQAQLSLITVLPGDELYSLFGHSAFRVYDPATGVDELFNYGTFDFSNPVTFALKFAYGKMDYMLSTTSYPREAYLYATYEKRPIIEQVLNLSPDQVRVVYQFLQTNALPENRTYRYDFLFDNCSTRLRDVLTTTLDGDVRFAPVPDPNESFRHLLDPYVADRPFLDLGFDLLLGMPTDRVATPREATFLPDYLMASFAHAKVTVDGTIQPLVARTDTVFWTPSRGRKQAALPYPAILFWLVFAGGAVLTYLEVRRGGPSGRVFDGVLFGIVGLVGLLIAFMWFVTEHTVTAWNLNLLWAWPTHLVAAVYIWRA
ncbi:MAG TPA: DUF4105 domain-containing protein, partial [Rhodothermales bacterium]|nr:DUF4105 domain-containing protein [Rhodothermales bacterium]